MLTGAASGARRTSEIRLGVAGNPAQFRSLTGQRSTVRLIFVAWNQGHGRPRYFAGLFSTMLAVPMLSLGTARSTLSPWAIAHGRGDAYLVALDHAFTAWGRPIYVRPLPEMNGSWNSYCAYDRDGSSRGGRYSTRMFRKAFARIYLIAHGDPAANAKLAKLGLPPVKGVLTPASNVQVIWNPQGYGSPDLRGNSARAYYPGNAYVDVVGDDLYDMGYKAAWTAAGALYRAHPRKPFAFPEWGLWGIDDASFVRRMGSFLRTHPRTVIANYFDVRHGSTWDLASKPRSRAAFRRYIDPLSP